jgi:hypothetical protein
MMIHLEGPIVDSLYDMALISWHLKFTPTLPGIDHPEVEGGLGHPIGNQHTDADNRADVLTGPTTVESVVHPIGTSSSQANEALVSSTSSKEPISFKVLKS